MSVKLTGRESVPAVLAEMTLEEKIQLVSGGGSYSTAPIERLGIPAALLIDNGAGVNFRHLITDCIKRGKLEGVDPKWGALGRYVFMMDRTDQRELLDEEENFVLDQFFKYVKENCVENGEMPSAFPVASLLASSWDEDAILEVARCVGQEASAYGVDMLLGTVGINLQRDPRGGRGFEYFSEDPYLISRLAPMYPIGVQESGVCADVKHYAINSQETNRRTINEIISERAIREIYLPGFKACVQKGGVKNIMTSYNYINGVAASQNKWLLQDVLRDEWGFDGFVVSDWGGVYDHPAAIKAGNDLRMSKRPDTDRTLEAALADGSLTEAELDLCVARILNAIAEMPCVQGRKYTAIDSERSKKAAYEAAAGGMVLLKNDGVLPLCKDEKIAFWGEKSKKFLESGIGSGRCHTTKTSSMVTRAAELCGEENVTFETVTAATKTVVVTVAAHGQEGGDRENIKIDEVYMQDIRAAVAAAKSVGAKVVLVLNVAGPVELEEVLSDVDAILLTYFPGQEGGRAAADILYGLVNPSGKLAQTFPKRLQDVPSYGNFPGEYNTVHYGEGIYVGYRWYDYRDIEPRYCFGHGLSYTTFQLSDAKLEGEVFNHNTDETIAISVKVKNTGAMAGAEVVQLYLEDPISSQPKPVRQLKGFKKVFLQPGEEKTVLLVLEKEDFMSFDETMGWVIEPGRFVARIGTSSRELPLSVDVPVKGRNPYGLKLTSSFTRVMDDQRVIDIFKEELPEGAWDERKLVQFKTYVSFLVTIQGYIKNHCFPLTTLTDAEKEAVLARIAERIADVDVSDLAAERYNEGVVL